MRTLDNMPSISLEAPQGIGLTGLFDNNTVGHSVI